jgi:hypothetical protein
MVRTPSSQCLIPELFLVGDHDGSHIGVPTPARSGEDGARRTTMPFGDPQRFGSSETVTPRHIGYRFSAAARPCRRRPLIYGTRRGCFRQDGDLVCTYVSEMDCQPVLAGMVADSYSVVYKYSSISCSLHRHHKKIRRYVPGNTT